MCYKYFGAIHIHTLFSDGSGNINDIVKSAQQAGLKWIIITDHNKIKIREGLYDNICVLCGEEISPDTHSHYLAFAINEVINSVNPYEYINEVHKQGGFGFIAHPNESLDRKNPYPPIRWQNRDILGDGIELWNYMSDWGDNYNSTNIFNMAYSFFFRNHSLKGPSNETLQMFDDENNKTEKIYPAICGTDAHAFKIRKFFIPLTVFSYKNMFSSLTNMLITKEKLDGNFEQQKQIILEALKNGNNFIINRFWTGNYEPEFFVSNGIMKVYSGGIIDYTNDTELFVKINKIAEIRIIKNGKIINIYKGEKVVYKLIENGKYRVEIYINGKPLAFSNYVLVK